jgi:general secretion pathway protein I
MSERQDGFTLVEVLVALAIVVLSFAVLFKVISSNLDRTREVRDQTAVASLLQSLLAQSAAAPQPGVTRGVFAGGYAWRVAVTPYVGEDERSEWPVDAVNVAATVSWRDGGHVETRALSTLRVLPKALPQ